MTNSQTTLRTLAEMKRNREKIAALTCYDASFTQLLESAGIDVLLVGDSLGMVIQGRDSTLPVTVRDMVYHTRNVARARQRALLIADMPFMSSATPARALTNGARLMRAGAQMVKLEGGAILIETVVQLTANGIPVCAHLGLLPQSVHRFGGYRVQGRDSAAADQIREDALALEQAGASLLVLECVPASLAAEVSAALAIPVIGIGAGGGCDGQVLVLYDMLGISPQPQPRFVRNFMVGAGNVPNAVAAYVKAVKGGEFPTVEQQYE